MKKNISRTITLLAAFAASSAILPLMGGCKSCDKPATASQEAKSVALFDGRTLTGWTQRGGGAVYTVENGAIVGETRPNQPNAFLCTTRDYADFDLTFEFKVDNELNSGVQFRSLSKAEYRNGVVHGYQFEIDPSPRSYSGGIYDEARKGDWIQNLADNPAAREALKRGEWNQGRVLCVGDHLQTWVNGVPAANVHDATTGAGFIALQVHDVGPRKEPLRVMWRNLKIREITP